MCVLFLLFGANGGGNASDRCDDPAKQHYLDGGEFMRVLFIYILSQKEYDGENDEETNCVGRVTIGISMQCHTLKTCILSGFYFF